MRVLYFTSPEEDYLSDSLLHGLRELLGPNLIDFPKREILYKSCAEHSRQRVRGHGFTLYGGLLEDLPVDRSHVLARVRSGAFDLIVFSDIWHQFGFFVQLRPWLDPRHTVIVDGADTAQVYPFAGLWWRRPYYWLLPRAHESFLYFKREWTSDTQFSLWHRAIPARHRRFLQQSPNLRPIAFSIPEEKIVRVKPQKAKDFPAHIIDAELARRLPNAQTSYAFSNEDAYYRDLQASRFGITVKRAGWDCLRHYEIAANGAVPCFRDLDQKPETCAPHGLTSQNSLIYRNPSDLFNQISKLSPTDYDRLQMNALLWARENSTKARAAEFLKESCAKGESARSAPD